MRIEEHNISIYIQSKRSPEKGQWITLPTSEEKIKEVIDSVCVDANDSYECTDFFTFTIIPVADDDLFELNKALKRLRKLTTFEEAIALTEIDPLSRDVYELLEIVKHKNYEFYLHKTLADVKEELSLTSDTTSGELFLMGYTECSTGIIKNKEIYEF